MSEGSRCPDCDSVKINPFVDEGDGNCSECHGTGEGVLLEQLVDSFNPFGRQGTECWKCHGTGQCQTCGGSGIVYD
jgi:DnaJ-class molecular chaperone